MTELSQQQLDAYTGLRSDVINLVTKIKPARVLDVGCSNGILLKYMKEHFGAETTGIEVCPKLAKIARQRVDRVINADLDLLDLEEVIDCTFDLIIMADILEHTKNPYEILLNILKFASDEAQIIISLPNIQHWTAIRNLIIGKWPQNERGLFDKTHLRFFTLTSITELADKGDLRIEAIAPIYRILDDPIARINMFIGFMRFLPFKRYFAYQYIVRMSPRCKQ